MVLSLERQNMLNIVAREIVYTDKVCRHAAGWLADILTHTQAQTYKLLATTFNNQLWDIATGQQSV